MKRREISLAAALLLSALCAAPLQAHDRERDTLEEAGDAAEALADIHFKGIPAALMRDAAGVAVIPHVVKAGLVVDGRFGRGVVLAHRPDGSWGDPLFLTLAGGESTDVVLVFKTRESLDRLLKGKDKLTLGGDVGVAAGPLGRQAEADTDPRLKAEIYSYSRSRGLFAGVSLEGSALLIDRKANDAFYGPRDGGPAGIPEKDFLAMQRLKARLTGLGGPIMPPPVIIAPEPPPPPPPPVVLPPRERR
jgi:lipid-binding SYLF domain-containing protein